MSPPKFQIYLCPGNKVTSMEERKLMMMNAHYLPLLNSDIRQVELEKSTQKKGSFTPLPFLSMSSAYT